MWGVFIGFALGVLQVVVLRKSVEMMTASKTNIALGVFISVGKLALILVTLWILARFGGLDVMLWGAGGIAAAMIGIPVVQSIRNINAYKKQERQGEE